MCQIVAMTVADSRDKLLEEVEGLLFFQEKLVLSASFHSAADICCHAATLGAFHHQAEAVIGQK